MADVSNREPSATLSTTVAVTPSSEDGLITEEGEVTDSSTAEFLKTWLSAFEVFVGKVVSVNRPK